MLVMCVLQFLNSISPLCFHQQIVCFHNQSFKYIYSLRENMCLDILKGGRLYYSLPPPHPKQEEDLTTHPLPLVVLEALLTSADAVRACSWLSGTLSVLIAVGFSFFLLLAQIAKNFPHSYIFLDTSSFSFFRSLLSEMPSISPLQKLSLWQLPFSSCPLTLL